MDFPGIIGIHANLDLFECRTALFYSIAVNKMIQLHEIRNTDVATIAALHCASWRAVYRGIFSDEFLDGDLLANREALWHKRLAELSDLTFGFIARLDGEPGGFSFVYGKHDEKWGSLIENLHVEPRLKGQGIGRQLLSAVAGRCQLLAPETAMFLHVYEANIPACHFYDSIGGKSAAREVCEVPGGGTAAELIYAWDSPAALLSRLQVRQDPA